MNKMKVLINNYIKKNNLKRSQLILNLGYENVSKGLRKLDEFIDEPTSENSLKLKLISSLQIPHEEMELSIIAQQQQISADKKMLFKPSIQTVLSAKPSPVFVAALIPKLWNIAVTDDLQLLNYHDEIKVIINKYQQLQLHHAKDKAVNNYDELVSLLNDYDVNNKPYPWVFGKGFRYFRNYGETLIFNRECKLVEQSKTIEPSIANLTIR